MTGAAVDNRHWLDNRRDATGGGGGGEFVRNSFASCSNDSPSNTGAGGLGSMARESSVDRPLQIRIVAREREGGAVLLQRVSQRSATMEDLGEAADRGEVFRGAGENDLELGLRLVELIDLDQGASERDTG